MGEFAEGSSSNWDFVYCGDYPARAHRPGARDQRLESFAQGRQTGQARPSSWLAVRAAEVSSPEVLADATADELLGVGLAWKSLEAWTFTGKLAVVRELIRRYPLNEDEDPRALAAGGLPDEWDPRLHHEVAAALGISVVTAAKLVNLAWTLGSRLPGISKALDDGLLDPGRARMIVDETSVLETEDLFKRAEEIILAGLGKCRTWADLVRLVQRAVITVDPEGARKRRERAEREEARLRLWREASGTCGLQVTGLPTDEALAAQAHIEARALEYKAARIRRPVEVLRVMAFADILNGVPAAQRIAWEQAKEEEARQADLAGGAGGAGGAGEQAAQDAEFREQATERASRDRSPGVPSEDERKPAAKDSGDKSPADAVPHDEAPDDDDTGVAGPGDDDPGDDDPGYAGAGDAGPDDDGPGDAGPDDDGPGDGSPRGGHPGRPSGDGPPGTRECGCGGGAGLPIRANLTLPAGAVRWLAQRAGPESTRGPGIRGAPGSTRDPGTTGGPRIRRPRDASCWPACTPGGSDRMPVRGNLTFPLLTLLGLASRPGEAHGLGALDPALVRALAAAGARHTASEFCVTVVDDQGFAIGHGCAKPLRGKAARPGVADGTDQGHIAGTADGMGTAGGTGATISAGGPSVSPSASFTPSPRAGPGGGYGSWILALPGALTPFIVDIDVVPTRDCDHRHGSAGYQPSDKLRHLIQVRDGRCSFPACSRHARDCDFEHAQPFNKGGMTCACNAHACSRSCHRVKQSEGWDVTKPRPGWTQWTTMAGRTYLQGPWRYPA